MNADPEVYNDNDKIISMWKCLDREGGPGRINNYNWDGKRQQINGLFDGTVKQNKAIIPKA